jgi:preprotein translocase subunit SecE
MALGRQLKPRKPATSPGAGPGIPTRGRFVQFLNEVIVELKKTTWPTPKEAWRLTTVVLGVLIVIGIYVGLIDFVLSWATKRFQLIR